MKYILFPTDFSSSSAQALDWARFLTKHFNATLVLVHVYQPPLPDTTLPTIGDMGVGMAASYDVEQIGQEKLAELVDQLRSEGLTIESDWRIGHVEDEILDAARAFSADLIITGRHDINTFFDRLAGSAATDVALDASCPVLVVPAPHENASAKPAQLGKIIYATQLEFDEAPILRQVVTLANAFGAALHFLKVEADNQPNVFDDAQFKAELQHELGDQPIQVELVHARTVTGGLKSYLDHYNADLLVMTTRERGFFDGLLNPSLTERMVMKAHLPLLVYHTQRTNL